MRALPVVPHINQAWYVVVRVVSCVLCTVGVHLLR